jgi:hypothetical protein
MTHYTQGLDHELTPACFRYQKLKRAEQFYQEEGEA